jgi:hypothetical protein
MAAAGQNYNQVVVLRGDPETTMQDLVAAVSGARGYTVNMGGPGSLLLTRKYTPTWAVVLGILGLLLFFLGMLFWLVKNTETVTASLRAVAGGTEVRISGVATPELQARFNAVFGSQQALETPALAAAEPDGASEPQPPAQPPLADTSPHSSESLEERLAKLGKMRDDGLIDEREYNDQRERLLRTI